MLNNKIFSKRILFAGLFVLAMCILPGCSSTAPLNTKAEQSNSDTGFMPALPGNYDSKDTAIIIKIDKEAMTLQLKTMANYKYYTLNFDGATCFYDKYGQALTLSQLHEGDIVDVTFMRGRKRLNTLNMAEGAFAFTGIDKHDITGSGHKMMIAGEDYTISEDLVVITDTGEGDLLDINELDILSVMGFEHTINSIIVERGHGYLRLEGEGFFIGGWLEIDERFIYPVEEDMLVAVPSGTYTVTITNDGCLGSETITVQPDSEYTWDVERWQGEEKKGDIVFAVEPDGAKVYVDSVVTDISAPVSLSYGIHQLIVVKEGYKTVSKYMKIGSASASINIVLEKENDSVSSSSANEAESTVSVSNGNVDITDSSQSDNKAEDNTEKDSSSDNKAEESASDNQVKDTEDDKDKNSEDKPEPPKPSEDRDVTVISSTPRVYINAPTDVEVYLDGKYIGISPVSFAKKAGTYVIILRKEGYQTRSFTLDIDNSDEDVNYSFSELSEESD